MSFLDRILEANAYSMSEFLPFCIDTHHVGWVRTHHAETLSRHDKVFDYDRKRLNIAPELL